MTRGTTPIISFSFDEEELDVTLVDYAEVTISQNHKNVIIKKLGLTSENNFEAKLSEEETLSLKPGFCQIQVKVKLHDNNVVATNIETVSVSDVLHGEVML